MTELGNIALASIASEDLYIDGSTSGVRVYPQETARPYWAIW
jgi:hypothetical protein